MIPPLPEREIIEQPSERIFSTAQDNTLSVHFDLANVVPGEALRVARLLVAEGKLTAVVHGDSDAWPTGDPWPPTYTSRYSRIDGSCSATLVVAGGSRKVFHSAIPTMDYVAELRSVGTISANDEDAFLCASAGSALADLSASDHERACRDKRLRDEKIMSITEVLAVAGLWQRSRHEGCHITPDGWVMSTSRWLSYLIAIRGRLPSAWRFVSQSYEKQWEGAERVGDLAFSVLTRLTYALRARDELHLIDWMPQAESPTREGLYQLDIVLLMISGAFDAAARAAFLVRNPGSNTRGVKWRNPGLMKFFANTNDLERIIGPQSRGHAVLAMLSCLRNLIHAETFEPVNDPSLPPSSAAGVPRDITRELLEYVSLVTSDPEAWGIVDLGDSVTLRPPVYVEILLDNALDLLQDLMTIAAPETGEPLEQYLPSTDDEQFGELPTSAAMLLCGVSNEPTAASVP